MYLGYDRAIHDYADFKGIKLYDKNGKFDEKKYNKLQMEVAYNPLAKGFVGTAVVSRGAEGFLKTPGDTGKYFGEMTARETLEKALEGKNYQIISMN